MKGQIFIDNYKIGIVEFKIIDESMGAIGGDFVASEEFVEMYLDAAGISENDLKKVKI